jgi:hypothetical protein
VDRRIVFIEINGMRVTKRAGLRKHTNRYLLIASRERRKLKIERWTWRSILTMLFGAIGVGLLAEIFSLTAKSTILRIYWIVVGGLTIKKLERISR